MPKVKVKKIGTVFYRGARIELSRRRGRLGRADYGYRLPSGAWGAGLGTVQGTIEAAKRAIREGKR